MTSFERLIVIGGMPRSGTSWLAQIVESSPTVRYRLCPPFAYGFKDRVDVRSSHEDWLNLFEDAYNSDNEYMTRSRERADGRYPNFAIRDPHPPVLTVKFDRFHDLMPNLLRHFQADGIRVVFIVRHPCGAIYSWLTAPREFPPGADPLAHWRDGKIKKQHYGDFFGFEDWKSITRMQLALTKEFPQLTKIVRYEALVRDPPGVTRDLFNFLALPFTPQTSEFLAASHSQHQPDTYSVYKDPAVVDRWRDELPPTIRDAIYRELKDSDLSSFLEDY